MDEGNDRSMVYIIVQDEILSSPTIILSKRNK
jgi:hypothetical protein